MRLLWGRDMSRSIDIGYRRKAEVARHTSKCGLLIIYWELRPPVLPLDPDRAERFHPDVHDWMTFVLQKGLLRWQDW